MRDLARRGAPGSRASALAALGLILARAAAAEAPAQVPAATIEIVLGEVRVAGSSQPATVGRELAPGDILRTGADGGCEVLMAGGARLRLGPSGQLAITAGSPDGTVALAEGELWAELAKGAKGLKVQGEGQEVELDAGDLLGLSRRERQRWRMARGETRVGEIELRTGEELTRGERRPRAGDLESMRRDALQLNREGARRWRGVLAGLVAAERRGASRSVATADPEEDAARLAEAMDEAEFQVEGFLEQLDESPAERDQGSAGLREFLRVSRRAFDRHRERRGAAGGVAVATDAVGTAGEGDAEDAAVRAARRAEGLLARYHLALRRAIRKFRRRLAGIQSALSLAQFQTIVPRVEGGYRQAQQAALQARHGGQPGKRSARARRAQEGVARRWRTVRRDFRVFRQLRLKLQAKISAAGP